jgi:hypothetical protein
MAIDFHCNLFTPQAIEKHWYGQPEIMRLIKWWRMEERVKGVSVDAFVAMMDAAGLDKALIPAIRMMSYQHKTGTNYPAVLHAESIACIRNELGLTEKVAEKILHRNAAHVYGL